MVQVSQNCMMISFVIREFFPTNDKQQIEDFIYTKWFRFHLDLYDTSLHSPNNQNMKTKYTPYPPALLRPLSFLAE